MSDHEIELKFACGADDLAAVLAAAPPGDDESRELISVYFDTPDLALQKAGASLRVRESKGRRVQTLKRGEGLFREEHEAPIDGLAPDPELGPLPSLMPQGASLRPAFNVRVSRRQRTFRYLDAEIELALDQGEVTGGEQKSPICEVELELKSGPPSALFALARELSAAAPLYIAFETKAARGQALVAGQARSARHNNGVELSSGASVAEAFQSVARRALAQIAANAAVLRADPGPDAVHQLRVGARRLRSALTAFKPALAGEGLDVRTADLRWLSHACDRARNLDVFAEETLRPAAGGPVTPEGLPALRKAVEAERRRAWASAADAASSARFRALMIDTTAWVETGDWRNGEVAGGSIGPFADRALTRRVRSFRKRARDARDGDDTARHRLRIEAKKLRYTAEALASLYGRKHAGRYLHGVRELQEVLGALNDLATVEPLIASLTLRPEAAFAAGELVGLQIAGKPRLVARAAKAAERLAGTKPFWG
ncbi:CHAD domain-containing protein [Phenylobacterium sp.]|uniref:CYTH and CHAD domain-containing protein n=1 Tax=Phenylobacterium sp. TaxID=1871053 RepID=UPI0035629C4F